MQIAHNVFSVSSSSGGIGPVVRGVTSALSSLDGISTACYVPTTGAVDDFPTPLKTVDFVGPPQYCLGKDLLRQVSKDQSDLIHCHGIWTFMARTNLHWKKLGKPYVISPHGMTMPAAMKFSRWKKILFWPLLESPNLKKADFLHALSVVEANSIRALGIKTPIIQIGNGVEIPTEVAQQSLNSETNSGVRTILYLGRLHPIKGVDKLISAWKSAHVNEHSPDKWRLQIVGWGEESYVQKLKDQSQDEDSIVFSGPLFDTAKHSAMNSANAFILPSSSEAFPMALMEAWSHGLPAVATTTCNVLGDPGKSVSLFVGDSVDEIASGILGIVEMTDQQRQTMGEAARKIVANEYSWQSIAQKFAASYKWVLGQGPEPTELLFD